MGFDRDHELSRLQPGGSGNGHGSGGGELVLAEVRTIERPRPASLPAVQAAAVAAGGFAAGLATVALAQRRARRRGLKRRRGAERLPIVGSRSFLVDIHLLDRS